MVTVTTSEAYPGTLMERMGIIIVTATPTSATATMPVLGNTQPAGLLHGGASAALAETVGSVAAQFHAGPGRAAVGLELSITHHRAVRTGIVTGKATALHLGRTTATYEVTITDDQQHRIASGRLTCILIDAPPDHGGR